MKKQRDRDIALDVNSRDPLSDMLDVSRRDFLKEEKHTPQQSKYSRELEPIIYSSKYMLAPINQKFEEEYKSTSQDPDERLRML